MGKFNEVFLFPVRHTDCSAQEFVPFSPHLISFAARFLFIMHKAILFACNTLNNASNILQCEQYKKEEQAFLNKLTD